MTKIQEEALIYLQNFMTPVYIEQNKPKVKNNMTKLLQRVEVTLRSFYIFNSVYGQKEGDEHKKILYYHPNDIELNTKIKDVGLSEAIITFTGTFTSDDDCKALHTQKTTQLFYQPEPGYWLVMVINVPKEIRSKDGIEVAEYRGSEVCDRVYYAMLQQCYNMFCFQNGTLQGYMTAKNGELDTKREMLAKKLQEFYDKHLSALRQLGYCDILDMLHSIQYLPLDKSLFLRAQNFSGMLSATFPAIVECIMFYNDQVVCGGKISAGDLYSLHAYLVEHVLELVSVASSIRSRSNSYNVEKFQNGAFVPRTIDEEMSLVPLTVYLSLENVVKAHHMLIYRSLNVTLCLFIDAQSAYPKPEFYDELHVYMGPQLTWLAHEIASEVSKQNASAPAQGSDNAGNDNAPKYLFINEQSLKHHTNIQRQFSGTQQILPRNIMSLIADLANPVDANDGVTGTTEELQVKTTNDFWIVKRHCNWRQYYVILSNSKATLLDVTHEAKRIFEQELTDDVFFDK